MERRQTVGHLAAVITVLIWGTTYISTKVLLQDFQPVEILFSRFVIGFLALLVVNPRRLKLAEKKQEGLFALAGLCGVCLYSLLENIALSYTMASNVGVIISTAPFFTAIMTHLLMKQEEKLKVNFFAGFLIAMIGICLISFNGASLELNPIGDLLALLATFVWGCYSVLTKKIGGYGYNTIQMTRKIFGYGLLFILPAMLLFDVEWNLQKFAEPVYIFNFLFLGLGASALCFVTWNYAVKLLGAVKTSVYIYLEPVITVVTSVLVLHETVTPIAVAGTVLTMAGLIVSEMKFGKGKRA